MLTIIRCVNDKKESYKKQIQNLNKAPKQQQQQQRADEQKPSETCDDVDKSYSN